jgi:hypothetical protein
MRSKPALALLSIAVVALGACTSAGVAPSAPTATQVAVATLTASAVPIESTSPTASSATEPTPSSGGGGGAKPTPGSIDPCNLLTADEASKAIGKKLSAGVSAQLDPNRVCTFKNGLTEVKVILAPPGPDAATAQAYWDEARSQVPAGISVKDLTEFDRSAYGSGSGAGKSLSGLFVIDGTNFFEFYCGFPACSQTASVGAAELIAGRLP